MASDLISREALKDELEKRFCGHCGVPLRGAPCGGCIIEVISEKIEHFPAVDAEPVRHGEWEVTVCSLCRHDLDGWADGAHEEVADGNVHYCPNCGAKMDGGKQDDEQND